MIVETIIAWFFSIVSNALSLLPSIGHTLDNVPAISLSFLKYIGVMNGYMPVNETGIAFGVMLGVFVVFNIVRGIFRSTQQRTFSSQDKT